MVDEKRDPLPRSKRRVKACENAKGNDMETAEKHTKAPATETKTITLDTPVRDGKVTGVEIRKPLGGALRGVALVDLMNMDTRSLEKILPRITTPALSEAECRSLDPADLVQMGTAVSTFLLGKRAEAEV